MELSHISVILANILEFLGYMVGRKMRLMPIHLRKPDVDVLYLKQLLQLFQLIPCKLFCSQNKFVTSWKSHIIIEGVTLLLEINFACQRMWEIWIFVRHLFNHALIMKLRGISSTWKYLLLGGRWLIGGGRWVRFWRDCWLPSRNPPINDVKFCVSDYVSAGG
ncbi:hypothetical protein CR513_35426, partial [Mucuna pruriens]